MSLNDITTVHLVGPHSTVVWTWKHNNQVRVKKKLPVKEGNEMKIAHNITKLETIHAMNTNRTVSFATMLSSLREKIWEVLLIFSVSKFISFLLKLITWPWTTLIHKALLVYETDPTQTCVTVCLSAPGHKVNKQANQDYSCMPRTSI